MFLRWNWSRARGKSWISSSGSPSPSQRRTVAVISILCTSRPAARGRTTCRTSVFIIAFLLLAISPRRRTITRWRSHGGGGDSGRIDTHPPSGCSSICRASTAKGLVTLRGAEPTAGSSLTTGTKSPLSTRSRDPTSATPILTRRNRGDRRKHLARTLAFSSYGVVQRSVGQDCLSPSLQGGWRAVMVGEIGRATPEAAGGYRRERLDSRRCLCAQARRIRRALRTGTRSRGVHRLRKDRCVCAVTSTPTSRFEFHNPMRRGSNAATG